VVTSLPGYLAAFSPAARRPARAVSTLPSPPVLERVARGEPDAVRECLRRYGGLVHAIAWRWSRDPRDVEDACQDVFLALWKSAGAFDPSRGEEATFVAMVARRRLIDRGRAPGSRPLPLAEEDRHVSPAAMEAYGDARVAASAVEECNEDQRRVILHAAVQGFTHDEIARELSIPLGTVKSHYARGIERVKRALKREERS